LDWVSASVILSGGLWYVGVMFVLPIHLTQLSRLPSFLARNCVSSTGPVVLLWGPCVLVWRENPPGRLVPSMFICIYSVRYLQVYSFRTHFVDGCAFPSRNTTRNFKNFRKRLEIKQVCWSRHEISIYWPGFHRIGECRNILGVVRPGSQRRRILHLFFSDGILEAGISFCKRRR
jgi:hypothetical protein